MQDPGTEIYSRNLHGPKVDSIAGTKLVNSSFWGDGIPEVKLPVSSQKQAGNEAEEGTHIAICTWKHLQFLFLQNCW